MGYANTPLHYPVSKLNPSPLLNLHPKVVECLGDAAYMSQAVRRIINLSDLYRLLKKDPTQEYHATDWHIFNEYIQAHGLISETDTIERYLKSLHKIGLLYKREYWGKDRRVKVREAYLVKLRGDEEDDIIKV